MKSGSYKTFHELPTKQLVGTIIGLQITLLLAAIDQTIVSTAMPKIIASLNGFDRYAWVTTSYMLTSTTSVPIFGKLSDMYGRKWILLAGAVLFVLSSALCGMAGQFPAALGDGMNQLIVFRGLQGIGAGVIMSLVFTVIGDIFPPAERGKYQGLFSAVWGLASLLGPTLGGFITDNFSWRWVFYVNMPVGALAILVLYFAFPYLKPEGGKRSIDYAGVATLIGFLVPLLLAMSMVVNYGWTSPIVLGMLAVSIVMFVIFLNVEAKAKEPIVELSLFRNEIISISSVSLVLLGIGMFGLILFVPLFMQGVMGVSATRSGSLLTPMMLAMTIGSMASGQIVSRLGHYKLVALSGNLILIIGMVILSQLGIHTTQFEMIRNMIIVGSGLGLLMPIYTLIVQNAVSPNMLGAATASTQFFRSVGGTLGAAVFGSLITSRYHDQLQQHMPHHVPEYILTALNNPLRTSQIKTQLDAMSMSTTLSHNLHDQLLALIQNALVNSIDNVFMIGAVVVTIALCINLFLKEIPLRKTHNMSETQPKALSVD